MNAKHLLSLVLLIYNTKLPDIWDIKKMFFFMNQSNGHQYPFIIKHRKNCECCPGHYLSTSVY